LVIGVDTIVVLGNAILGKPETRAEARSMLRRLSGRWHEVLSGICLIDCSRGRSRSSISRSRVHFRRLSSEEIEWYLRTGEYCDKAGAYGIQGYASLFIDRIEGCYFNIVGFPITAFQRLGRQLGIDLIREMRI
jgi:septum formation protein